MEDTEEDGVKEEEPIPDVDIRTVPAPMFNGELCPMLDWKNISIPYPGVLSSANPRSCKGKGNSSPDSRLWDPDPFYPYMHCLPASQSTSTTSGECSTHQVEIPVWRALVRSDTGLEYRLGPPLKDDILNQGINYNSSEAIVTLEQRRSDVISSRNNHDLLLAWSNLALAQLYQSMGGEGMLKEAMNRRKEVLDCVLPLQSSRELLVRVCKTYYYTSQYEWGAASVTSEAMNEAKQEYAKLMRCNEREAEAQLCFLLGIDHEYFGSSEKSLRWVQEANRQREIHSLDAGRNCMQYFLGYEAKLLMKQGKYEDAVSILKKLTDTNERDDPENAKHAVKFHKLLEECYVEMSRRTGEGGLGMKIEESVELYRCLRLSLCGGNEDSLRRTMNFQCMLYSFGHEAKLLMKQGMYEDAVSILEKLTDTNECDDPESAKHAVKFHKLLEECYVEMSRRTDEDDSRIRFEHSAELHHCLQLSLGGAEEDSLETTHQLWQRAPSPLGSSLGLFQAIQGYPNGAKFLIEAMEKLPEAITSSLRSCLTGLVNAADDAAGTCSDQQKILSCEQFRELLKMAKNLVDEKTYDWLLSWIDLLLANLYQYRAGKSERATLLWKEMRQCAERQLGSDLACLIEGYDMMYDAVSSEKRVAETHPNIGVESDDTVRRPVESRLKSLFWLFFGHMGLKNWDSALKLLREAKSLKEELRTQHGHDCAMVKCWTDYFSSDLDYFRCETVILLELGKFDEATVALKNLINTKHVREGSQRIVMDAKVMLMGLGMSLSSKGSFERYEYDTLAVWKTALDLSVPDTLAVLQYAIEYSATGGNNKHESFEENLPPTGIVVDNMKEFHGLGSQSKLSQSPAGLDHHLYGFPLQCSMAFRKHANEGCLHLERGDWDKAIFNFEWCIELIMMVQSPENEDACNWLVVWASLPLANIYQFKKKNLKRALDAWRQMEMRIPQSEDSTSELYRLNDIVRTAVWTQEYQYVVSDLKDIYLKKLVVKEFYDESLIAFQDENAAEYDLLKELSYVHFDTGCYGDALNFIQEAKRYSPRLDDRHGMKNVLLEAYYSGFLGMHDKAYEVLRKYKTSELTTQKPIFKTSLYTLFQVMEKNYYRAKSFGSDSETHSGDSHFEDIAEHFREKSENSLRKKLREDVLRNMLGFRDNTSGDPVKSLEEAIQRYEESFMSEKTSNRVDLTDDYQVVKFDYVEYFMLAQCYELLCERNISSKEYLNYEQVKEYQEDTNFERTLKYLEKFVEASPGAFKAADFAKSQAIMTKLYAALEIKYYAYFFKFCLRDILDLDDVSMREEQASLWRKKRDELHAYLETTQKDPLPVESYGKEAVTAYAQVLRNVEISRYSDAQWLSLLKDHEELYSTLQEYHYRRAEAYKLLCTGFGYKDSDGEIEKQINICQWNAFMYAEGERTRSMLLQLRNSNKLSSIVDWGFDASQNSTWKAIQAQYCRTLPKRDTIFVQYSRVINRPSVYKIYIIDQDGKLSVEECDMDRGEEESKTRWLAPRKVKRPLNILEDKLAALYDYHLEPKKPPEIMTPKEQEILDWKSNYNSNFLEEDLEFLYGKLIRPFAAQLKQIQDKPHHKLILAPTELLSKVPFAALRDKVTGKYLIQSHTISVTPSLRVLQVCIERLQELRSSPPYNLDHGSIVALGDPTFSCKACKKQRKLDGTCKEVEYIYELFDKTAPNVVHKLLQKKATKEELLKWAKTPSLELFRQAIIHIGAHGVIDEKDQRNNKLLLACDAAESKPARNYVRSDIASTSRSSEWVQRDDYCSDEDHGSDSDDEGIGAIFKSPSVSNPFIESMGAMMAMHTGSGVLKSPSSGRGGPSSSENSHHLLVSRISSSEWKWIAELVVLSACRTSRGRVTTEGVLSMARSFMIAGVPCVVASLSEIDDKATSKLMRVFYMKLHEGEDVASALRSAMCALIDDHREVKEWAPFNVLGVPSLCIPEELQRK